MSLPRSCILTYHSLDLSGSVISVSPELFRRQMAWLAASGARVVPLAEIQQAPGAIALTFDDAFQNFQEHALPALAEHGFPATVFVVSGRCGGWNDWGQPDGIPRLKLMGWSELESLARTNITLGAHTVTHPHLTALHEVAVEQEMSTCGQAIEDATGRPVETFAYPYGSTSPVVRRVAGRHFRQACGTLLDYVSAGSDPLELPRIDVHYVRSRHWFEGLGKTGGAAYITARRWLREVRPAVDLLMRVRR